MLVALDVSCSLKLAAVGRTAQRTRAERSTRTLAYSCGVSSSVTLVWNYGWFSISSLKEPRLSTHPITTWLDSSTFVGFPVIPRIEILVRRGLQSRTQWYRGLWLLLLAVNQVGIAFFVVADLLASTNLTLYLACELNLDLVKLSKSHRRWKQEFLLSSRAKDTSEVSHQQKGVATKRGF